MAWARSSRTRAATSSSAVVTTPPSPTEQRAALGEREAAGQAERPDLAACGAGERAERRPAVLDQRDRVRVAELAQQVGVGRMAPRVRGDDGARRRRRSGARRRRRRARARAAETTSANTGSAPQARRRRPRRATRRPARARGRPGSQPAASSARCSAAVPLEHRDGVRRARPTRRTPPRTPGCAGPSSASPSAACPAPPRRPPHASQRLLERRDHAVLLLVGHEAVQRDRDLAARDPLGLRQRRRPGSARGRR